MMISYVIEVKKYKSNVSFEDNTYTLSYITYYFGVTDFNENVIELCPATMYAHNDILGDCVVNITHVMPLTEPDNISDMMEKFHFSSDMIFFYDSKRNQLKLIPDKEEYEKLIGIL